MSNVISKKMVSEELFAKSVAKFKAQEKRIGKVFLKNVISLGKILHEEKKIWKAKRLWTDYLKQIDKTMSGANQYIRLYQYSIKNKEILRRTDLVNWERANAFLALDDSLRNQLAWSIDGAEIDQEKFKEQVRNVRMDEDITEDDYLDNPKDEIKKNILERINLSVVDRKAKDYVVSLMKDNKNITVNSIPIVSALIHLSASIKKFNMVDSTDNEKYIDKLSKIEKRDWIKILRSLTKDLRDTEDEMNPLKK